MAITFGVVSDFNKSSILRPIDAELSVAVTSSVTLANKLIFVTPTFFASKGSNIGLLQSSTPKYGYTLAFPGSNGTSLMTKQGHQFDFAHENTRIYLDRTSTTTFNLRPEFLMTCDVMNQPGAFNVNSLDRVMKNSRNNPKRLDNGTISVYSTEKVMRLYVIVADTEGTILDQGYKDINFNSRFYEKGLNDGVSEFTDFAYSFTQGGKPINGLSTISDVKIRLACNDNTYWTGGSWVYLFKESSSNNTQFWKDIDLKGKYYAPTAGSGSAIQGLENDILGSCTAITTISGNEKYIEVTIDKDFVEIGTVYRCVFVPVKTNDFSNSFITEPIKVVDFNELTTGRITDTIEHYDIDEAVFNQAVYGLAVSERIRVTAYMDKATYNTAIAANSSTGNFDSNFIDYKMLLTDYPIVPGDEIGQFTEVADVQKFDTVGVDAINGGYAIIRIPESWENKNKYITHVWTFDIQVAPGYVSQDVIYYQQRISVDAMATDDKIQFVGFFDEDGNSVSKICIESPEIIKAKFENMTMNEYDLIAYVNGEENLWINTNFDKQDNGAVTALDQNFVDNVANVTINTKYLDLDKDYKVELIGINKTFAIGECLDSSATVYLGIANGIISANYLVVNGVKEVYLTVKYYKSSGVLSVFNYQSTNQFENDIALNPKAVFENPSAEYYVTLQVLTENGCLITDTETFSMKGQSGLTKTFNLV